MRKWMVFALAGLMLLAVLPALAASGTFSNPAPIAIPATGTLGVASPFPSDIVVSGLTGAILDVNVTVSGLSHTWPGDVQIVLAGPGGRTVTLLSLPMLPLNPWGTPVAGANLTFDDQAAGPINSPVVSGTFRPTQAAAPANLGSMGGPAAPYGSALSEFNGANPNGSWRLYVYDRYSGNSGQIAGGWSIELTTADAGVPVVMTCNPPLTANAVVGSLPYDTQAWYEPGNEAQGVVLNAGTYHVLGVDEAGQYYAIVLGCDRLWVPVASMVPNNNPDDALWFGHPLPTTVIAS